MTLVQHLVRRPPRSLSDCLPRLRTAPRVALGSGARVGDAVRQPPSLLLPVALTFACELAQSSGLLVSLAVAPPFEPIATLLEIALAQSGACPERLELTVSWVAGKAGIDALLALSAVRDQGVGIALRGYSASTASVVPRLPLSAVIFSPGAVSGVPGSADITASIDRLLTLARHQGLGSTAAGIDSELQRAVLSGLGCDAGEGSLFGIAQRTRAAA